MTAEIDAAVASLKQDARAQRGDKKRKRKRRQAVSEAEQIRRFLSGAEKQRLLSGEISLAQYREYQETMLDKLASMGALQEGK